MTFTHRRLNLPLLRKELTEQSARRRTYLVRVAYALLLFCAFAGYYINMAQGAETYALLGLGLGLFEFLMALQFMGIYLLLPAMMSTTLTREKERDSLGLLFLTDLSPTEILLEKYLGRLLPMLLFLLLGLPLLGTCYTLGGFSLDYLLSGVWLLLVCCLQVGAIGLLCSAWCRNSMVAFLATYGIGLLFYLGPLLCHQLCIVFTDIDLSQYTIWFAHVPHLLFWDYAPDRPLREVLQWSLVGLSHALLLFALARLVVLRRAFLRPRNHLLVLFKGLDRLLNRANQRVGGHVLIRPADSLPLDRPIAWRERSKKALGQTRYRVRLLLVLQLPTMIALLALAATERVSSDEFRMLLACLWGLPVLFLTTKGASLIAGERSSQTLDVLLTTPLAGREILEQKTRWIGPLVVLFGVPLLSQVLFKTWWIRTEMYPHWGDHYDPTLNRSWIYLLSASINLLVFLPLCCWLGIRIGLQRKSRASAVIIALGTVVAWCVVWPIAYLVGVELLGFEPRGIFAYLVVLSPAAGVWITEAGKWHYPMGGPLGPIFLNLVWHGTLWYHLRADCLNRADRLLGRAPSATEPPGWLARGREVVVRLVTGMILFMILSLIASLLRDCGAGVG